MIWTDLDQLIGAILLIIGACRRQVESGAILAV